MAGGTSAGGRRIVTALLVPILLLAHVPACGAQELRGKVVGVADGDTITVFSDGRPQKTRLDGIDAPEMGQPFGDKARQFTARLVFGQDVTVHVMGRDRYGRTLGHVILADGRSLNHELVRAGYAWWFRRYSNDGRLRELETGARRRGAGLWADPNPIAPWEWRNVVLR
jgi:endonuclease YncB( thermonuclease family)